jgi:predicted lipid-binding transport protein (Tim44 family)
MTRPNAKTLSGYIWTGRMNTVLDIYTIIFLVLAVLIFLRLRSVLGKRTGFERPPQPNQQDDMADSNEAGGDKVITIPHKRRPDDDNLEERMAGIAKEGSALEKALKTVLAADRNFNPRQFIEGAKGAYEMIVTAFAEGDKQTLKPLLSDDVYNGFASAIDEREERDETTEFTFIGIDKTKIIQAELEDRQANITVRFKSQIISVTKDEEGRVVDGDPTEVNTIIDVWTFARDVSSSDPNWKLVATEADEPSST